MIETIDQETGEIVETLLSPDTNPDETLSRLARAVRSMDAEITRLNSYKELEVSRIVETTDQKVKSIEDTRTRIMDTARQIMESIEAKSRDYPGLGKFAFRKNPDSVDSTGYEAMDEEAKRVLATESKFAVFFKTKITFLPDKKQIMVVLKAGKQVDGFAVAEGETKITFKGE